jgi:peptidylprolyl isomerase
LQRGGAPVFSGLPGFNPGAEPKTMKTVAIAAVSVLALASAAWAAPAKKPAHPAAAAKTPPAAAESGMKMTLSSADFRDADPENTLVIDTTKGRVIVELIPEVAPKHVERIKELARKKIYDGLTFFRVIDMFMAQTGDPQNTGSGSTEEPNLAAEFIFRRGKDTPFATVASPSGTQVGFVRSLPVVSQSDAYMGMTADNKAAAWGTYCPGVMGMARDDNPDSANSQFFLMRQSYPSLDKRYTAFGRVISGLDVVRAIKPGEPPADPDKMTLVRVLADIPEPDRPRVRVLDPAGPAFKALVASTRAAKGADFSVCDIDIPVEVSAPRWRAAVSP